MGSQPGDDAAGQQEVMILAFLAVLAGIVAAAVPRRAPQRPWPAALIPLAAAAWMTAHFYSFDSYYLPSLTRFSQTGSVSAKWTYGVVACALVLAAVVSLRPRAGQALSPLLLLVCAGTVLAHGVGH